VPDGNSHDARCFQQIHVDAARNSTDDFNPFHEPRKCGRIRGNPYAGAIVLGFQLEQLLEHEVDIHRDLHGERRKYRWIRRAYGRCCAVRNVISEAEDL